MTVSSWVDFFSIGVQLISLGLDLFPLGIFSIHVYYEPCSTSTKCSMMSNKRRIWHVSYPIFIEHIDCDTFTFHLASQSFSWSLIYIYPLSMLKHHVTFSLQCYTCNIAPMSLKLLLRRWGKKGWSDAYTSGCFSNKCLDIIK